MNMEILNGIIHGRDIESLIGGFLLESIFALEPVLNDSFMF
jgi:hypothetical protein